MKLKAAELKFCVKVTLKNGMKPFYFRYLLAHFLSLVWKPRKNQR
jgi:hypothetical protein